MLVTGAVTAQGQSNTDYKKLAKSLTMQQKASQAEGLLKSIKKVHSEILAKLQKARANQDIVAVDCLGGKLTSAKALLFLAERDGYQLREAVVKKNEESVNHLFAKIAETEGRVRDLGVESDQCWGKQGVYTGKTDIRVTTPTDLVKGDPTLPSWKEPVVYRPSNASGFF